MPEYYSFIVPIKLIAAVFKPGTLLNHTLTFIIFSLELGDFL